MKSSTSSRYVDWLRSERRPLFRVRDIYWEVYNKGLVPAHPGPCFISLTNAEALDLLHDSRAWFLHYASDRRRTETEWWYVVCETYESGKLSANTRSKINRGRRRCSVKRVTAAWLAENGYDCYVAAYRRYTSTLCVSKKSFQERLLRTGTGPFEHWAVFVGEELAGYCECIVEEQDVATSVVKLHPAHLKHYSSYALMDALLRYYVAKQGLVVNNGTRSIAHETQFQEFLIKLGFQKWYCRLNVVYPKWLERTINSVYPFRNLLARLPRGRVLNKVQSMLIQEELRRLCR